MNTFRSTITFFLLIFFIGCGNDGTDGDVYLRIRAVLEPTNVMISNPDLPSDANGVFVGEYDVYYQTQPGSYSFTYVDHNGIQHPLVGEFGVVNLFSNSGEESGLFTSGEDGEDVYVDLILLSTGAIIENYDKFTIATSLNYSE